MALVSIVDDFFAEFDKIRNHSISVPYDGEVNPVDGVLYPDISTNIHPSAAAQLIGFLGGNNHFMFMRLTTKNTKTAPHQAHNDASMGRATCLVYINPGEGGTSILDHRDGGMMYSVSDCDIDKWHKDTNNYDAWVIKEYIRIKPNRLVLFPSSLMHRAEPVGGFGNNAEDGRLVLTCFYDP